MILIDGVEKTLRAIGKARNKDADSIESAIGDCARIVLKKALYYVPRETGALAESGRIEESGKGFGYQATIEFGGSEAPYAMIQHENPMYRHTFPTCYKYLERAARESRGTMAALVKRRMEGRVIVAEPTIGTISLGGEGDYE